MSAPENIALPKDIKLKEKDKPILLAALSVKADYLITGEFTNFGKFYGPEVRGVKLLPPSQYLKKRS